MPQLNFETDRRHAMAKRSVHLTGTEEPANVTSEDCHVDLLPVSSFGKFPCDFDEGGAYYSGAAIPVRGLQIPGDQGYGDFASSGTFMEESPPGSGNFFPIEYTGRYHNLDPSELVAPSFRLGTACHAEFRQTKLPRGLSVYNENTNPNAFSAPFLLNYVQQTSGSMLVSNRQFETSDDRIFEWTPVTMGGPNNAQGTTARPVFGRSGTGIVVSVPNWYSCDDVMMGFNDTDFSAQYARLAAEFPNHIAYDTDPAEGDVLEGSMGTSEVNWYFIIYPTTVGFDMQIWFVAGRDFDRDGTWPVPSYSTGTRRESAWHNYIGGQFNEYGEQIRGTLNGAVPGWSLTHPDTDDLLEPYPRSIVVGWEASTTKQHLNDHLPVTFSLMPASELRGTNPFGAGQLTMNFSDVASPPLDAIDALNCFP